MKPAHSHLWHWKRPGAAYFVTWRLAGSLPAECIADLLTVDGPKFVALDRMLDARAAGPQWLMRPEIAEVVCRVLVGGEHEGFYELGSWVVMPNHVHALLRPLADLSKVMTGIKGNTARKANLLLGRTGPFWSRDYFDRWIRNSDEEHRVIRYIANNPVKAAICDRAELGPFSSAGSWSKA